LRAVELRGGQGDGGEIVGFFPPLGFPRPLDARHRESGVARELLDRVGKGLAPVLHQEADRGAVYAATEAVIELLGRAYRERRRLFAVKRTAGAEIGAGLLERYVAIDDVDDVDPGQQRLYEIVRNHGLRDREPSAARDPNAGPDGYDARETGADRSPGRVTRQGTQAL